jgi:hypothetical protein
MLFFDFTASAATPPPKSPLADSEFASPVNSKNKPSTGFQLGSLKVTFDEATLGNILAAAGVGEISHQGDAGGSTYWICYTVLDGNPNGRIWITSDGEMGGREHAVTGISAEVIGTTSATPDCPALPRNLKPVSVGPLSWFGSAADANAALGVPSFQKGDWKVFNYEGKRAGKCEPDGFDVLNWFMIRTAGGVIDSVQAGQVTSC